MLVKIAKAYSAAIFAFILSVVRDMVIARELSRSSVASMFIFITSANLLSSAVTGYISLLSIRLSPGKIHLANILLAVSVFLPGKNHLLPIFLVSSFLSSLYYGRAFSGGGHWVPHFYLGIESAITLTLLYFIGDHGEKIVALSRVTSSSLTITHIYYSGYTQTSLSRGWYKKMNNYAFAAVAASLLIIMSVYTESVFKSTEAKTDLLFVRWCITLFSAISVGRTVVAEALAPHCSAAGFTFKVLLFSCVSIVAVYCLTRLKVTNFSAICIFILSTLIFYLLPLAAAVNKKTSN